MKEQVSTVTTTTHPLFMTPFIPEELKHEIKKLHLDKSPGPSGITNRMLQAGDTDFQGLILIFYKFMGVKNTSLSQQYVIYSTPFQRQSMPIVAQNAATTPAKNRFKKQSGWQTTSNCRHFLDNLYQIQFSDCSAPPESRLQYLTHPYRPLKNLQFSELTETRV